jgi:hypothetical protein
LAVLPRTALSPRKLMSAMWLFLSVGSIIAAIVIAFTGLPVDLVVATGTFSGVVILFWSVKTYWQALARDSDATGAGSSGSSSSGSGSEPSSPSSPTPEAVATAITQGSNVITTVQGVILGLVFGLVGQSGPALTVKVGMVSLAAGLISGLLLYSLSAVAVPDSNRFIAGMLYTLSILALAYGLLCIVSAAVAGHVVAGK